LVRWKLLPLIAASCADSPTWTWSFIDPRSHQEVSCPSLVDRVAISVWQAFQRNGGECGSSGVPLSVGQDGPFSCEDYGFDLGTFEPQHNGCHSDEMYVQFYALTAENDVYSRTGHGDLVSNRGLVDLSWTLVQADGTTPTECPFISGDATVVTTSLGEQFHCEGGHARTEGLRPDDYALAVMLQMIDYRGSVVRTFDSPPSIPITITADAITDVSVTFTVTE
jgi:hypothetical protein